jgi:hypothetical protein
MKEQQTLSHWDRLEQELTGYDVRGIESFIDGSYWPSTESMARSDVDLLYRNSLLLLSKSDNIDSAQYVSLLVQEAYWDYRNTLQDTEPMPAISDEDLEG